MQTPLALFACFGKLTSSVFKVVIPTDPCTGLTALMFEPGLLQWGRHSFALPFLTVRMVLCETLLVFSSAFLAIGGIKGRSRQRSQVIYDLRVHLEQLQGFVEREVPRRIALSSAPRQPYRTTGSGSC